MRKNKFLLVVLAIILMFSLVACNNQENLNDNNNIEKENEDVGDNMENDVVLSDEIQPDNTENEDKFKNILISKTWQCYNVTDMSGNELSMQEVFGTGIAYGYGKLEFKSDGTFENIEPGISSDEFSTTGTYEVNDLEITLNYDDGRKQNGTLNVDKTDFEVVLNRDNDFMHFQYAPEKKDFDDILTSDTWQCYKVTDMSANEVRMQEVFGSGYGEGAGSLVFNTDGTFKHIMPGITSDEASTAGTYSLIGIVVSLNYDDGNWVDGRLYVGESESEIELINQLDGYRMYFHQTVEK